MNRIGTTTGGLINPYALSDTELQLVPLLIEGLDDGQISEQLNLDFANVARGRATILQKCRAQGTSHLVHILSTLRPEFLPTEIVYLDDLEEPAATLFELSPQQLSARR